MASIQAIDSVSYERLSKSHLSDHIRRPKRPPLAPSDTTYRIQAVPYGAQGSKQPHTIVRSKHAHPSNCSNCHITAAFFIYLKSEIEASIRVR